MKPANGLVLWFLLLALSLIAFLFFFNPSNNLYLSPPEAQNLESPSEEPGLPVVERIPLIVEPDLPASAEKQASRPRDAEIKETLPEKSNPGARVEKLQNLAELALISGLDPTAVAEASMDLLDDAIPSIASAAASPFPGSIQYSLSGLPDGVKGTLQIENPGQDGLQGLHAILEIPYSNPRWVEGLPRRAVRISLTLGVQKAGEVMCYGVNADLPFSSALARESGIEPTSAGVLKGIGYQKAIDGNIYVHRLLAAGAQKGDWSLIAGSQELSPTLVERTANFLRGAVKVVKPEAFK